MDAGKVDRAWALSLIVAGVSAVILAAARLTGAQLPDMAVRVMGALDLLALPVLAFSTVQRVRRSRRQSKG